MESSDKRTLNQQFVRNEQLCRHYHSIGLSLLAYEKEAPILLRSLDERAMFNLKVALSFLHDSILDSYLEDLLDLGISDKQLFVATSGFSPRRLLIALPLAGLLSAWGLGFYLTTLDVPNSFCIAATVLSSIPFAVLWEWVPRSSNRRLFFARVIAAELSKRRGGKRVGGDRKIKYAVKDTLVPSMGKASQG